jgi:hypothetical protein
VAFHTCFFALKTTIEAGAKRKSAIRAKIIMPLKMSKWLELLSEPVSGEDYRGNGRLYKVYLFHYDETYHKA